MPMIDMRTLRNAIPWTIVESMDEDVLDEFEKTLSEDNGQTLRCSLMEPCPFCGGTTFIQTHQMGDAGWESRAVCQDCHVSTSYEWQSWGIGRSEPYKDYTRLIAIAKTVIAWNKRYERVSIPKVCHGDHGPEPRFPGDVWTMFHVCGLCDEPISKPDKYCKHCGAPIDWSKL